MNETITIIKGNFLVTEEVTKLLKNEENIVISLDYESHKQLDTIRVKHVGFENYLNETDNKMIDTTVFHITTNWHKNEKIQQCLTLNEINLGWLLDQELYLYLLTTITNFVSFIKIKEKLSSPKLLIISKDLQEMAKTIFPNCKVQHLETKEEEVQLFNFDVYSIKYNIGQIPITIRLPRKYFFTLRKYYEKSFIPLYNKLFSKIKKDNSSVLLVDFNPAREDEFLKCLAKKNKNIYLLNRRRAAIWNLKSFLIVKNTKSIPVTYEQFLDSSDNEEIKKLTNDIIKKLDLLLSDEKLFSEIFSINNHSFWNCIHKYFRNFCVNRFSEAIYEMVGARKLLSEINPSVILHFFGVALQEKILIHEVKKRNISAIMVQHGTPHIFFPGWSILNPISGTLPIYDEKMAVWGNMIRDYALKNGLRENNVIVSGSIRHDSYFKKKNHADNEGIILVALMPFVIIYAEDQTIAAFDKYEESLKILCRTLQKIKDRKKIVKLHPGDMVFNTIYVEPIIRSIDPSIQIVVEADLTNLIPSADIVITLGLTTFLLDANIFGKPTVTIMYNHGEFLSRLSNGHSELFENADHAKFEEYVHNILVNDKIRNENIIKGTEFVNSYLANHGHASEYLANIISETS